MENDASQRLEKGFFALEEWFGLLFRPDTPEKHPWFNRIWLAGLLIAGIVVWGIFFNYGAFPLTLKDWSNITGPRLAILQDAIKKNALPLHISDSKPLNGLTDRYLSIPDQLLSPQVLLLRFTSITRFIYLDVVLLYGAGFLGLLWFKRKFSLSLIAFTVLTILFNFNGYIVAHFAIGHLVWGGYFLIPWFAALVFRLVDGERGWGWIAWVALLLFAIFLQGSYHLFAWCLIFLAFLALIKRSAFFTIMGGAVCAVLASMVRILPAAIIYGEFSKDFIGGYRSLSDVWYALVNTLEPGENATVPMMAQAPQRWELTMYIGLVGALFLVFFGVYRWLKGENGKSPYLGLAIPVYGMFLLSFDLFYRWLFRLNIPLLEGEHISSRIICLPFVFILLFAVIEFQRWLNQPRTNGRLVRFAAVGLLLIGWHDLWINFKLWLPARLGKIYPPLPFDRPYWTIANHSDPAYITALAVGGAVSILSIALLIFLVFRRHITAISPSPRPH